MKIIKISELDIPNTIKKILEQQNYVKLYPPQAKAIEDGVLDGKNLVLAIPTASGKTLIAELAMLKSIIEKNGKAVYLVPLRALASEKYENFKKWENLGVKVNISTSDYDQKDSWLKNYQLIVSTNEKFDSLFRHRAKWLSDITIFVFDEVHLLNDPERGPTLEILITKVKKFNKNAQIIALSATVKNAREIAKWLNASVVISNWRPVKLKEGVYFDGRIYFPGTELKIPETYSDPIIDLVTETVKNKKQALIFTDTRRSAVSTANKISSYIYRNLKLSDRKALKKIAKKLLTIGAETQIRSKLSDLINKGVAFHHAGLIAGHRKLIEESFKNNIVKILCATPTLAAGVNLPAKRVIISRYSRFDPNFGSRPIPVLEYKQFAGRAGRPKYDTEGEAILIANTENEKEFLLENYILGETEPINSKLAQESILRTHILGLLAMGTPLSKNDVREFIKKTFFAFQSLYDDVHIILDDVIDFLLEEELVKQKDNFIIPTNLGRRISQLYIDPKSGIILKNAILNLQDKNINTLGILHLISHTPDIPNLYLRKRDYEELIRFVNKHRDDLFFEINEDEDLEWLLSEMKVASILYSWINEVDEDSIIIKFGIGPGDIHRYVQLFNWLLYAFHEIARLYKKTTLIKYIDNLQLRIKYGVKKELLELVSLKGIGRVKARILYNHGYNSINSLKKAKEHELLKLDYFGSEIIKSIYNQLGVSIGKLTQRSAKKKLTNQKSIDEYL
ncbi:MAG: DEAD/DEAH box helicase [Candidatus Helarchaeota archaeon]